MAGFTPAAVVAPIPRPDLQFGLFSVLGFREGGARWQSGVEFEQSNCEAARGYGAGDCDPAVDIPGLPMDFSSFKGGEGKTIEASAFGVYGWWACTPVAARPAEAYAKAQAHLQASEEARVERALWYGDLGNTPNFAGANGMSDPANLGSFDLKDIWTAISVLEAYIAVTYHGVGVIHMSRLLASFAVDKSVSPKGGRLQTPLGTPIVAGTGYGSDKLVATGAMAGYRSDAYQPSNVPYDLLDRQKNDFVSVAMRDYLVGFDNCGFAQTTIAGAPSLTPIE
jgi:hypothetical protein